MTHADVSALVRHLLVEGRVQGVGFRWFARERARRLALRGWVKNCADGSVEVIIAGPSHAVDQFVKDLGVGPTGAIVEVIRDVVNERREHTHDGESTVEGDAHELPFPFVIVR